MSSRTGSPSMHLVLLAAMPALTAAPAWGQAGAASERLGEESFPASCGAAAQPRLDRAVALLHHMTYPEARRVFAAVAKDEPGCAIAHWGVAMTLFQPLWPTRPTPADVELGRAEVAAAERAAAPTARERAYVATAAAFFGPAADYWTRIDRWEAATLALHRAFPDDPDAATFYALAHLATAPPTGGTQHQDSAARVLARVLETHPMHPGAIHYTIHANDAPGRAHDAPDVVRRYLEIAPENPHALHMPTHIFVRLGEWREAIRWNVRAAQAALEQPAGEAGQWVWDEFPHATEYLVYAELQLGDDAAARAAMERLLDTPRLQPGFKTAFHLASVPARYALERGDWAGAAALRPLAGVAWADYPWPESITWFARGLGAARGGDARSAMDASTRLVALRDAAERAGESLFARNIEVLRLELDAWRSHTERDDSAAVGLMRQAVALERVTPKHPVTPAPTLPAAELLGDLLLELGRPGDALVAYRTSLAAWPRRFDSLLGAARAAAAAGDGAAAAAYADTLRTQVVPDSPRRGVIDSATRGPRGG